MACVAAVQLSSNCSVSDNLATCLRMIDLAAQDKPRLMVLPEFCNHISWYDDMDHAWAVALDVDGEFLRAIAERAQLHQCYIVINVSLRRVKPAITVSSLLFSPAGECVLESDKQTLMGHENDFFVRAECLAPVVTTPVGRLGLFPCRDGVTFETPRGLALRGAQIFCDSLNSFALDEASLHVPVRAPENKAFLIAANKVGPLIPEAQLPLVSEAAHIPVEFLMGAGESQIVAPDGTVLAKAPRDREAVIFAEIDVDLTFSKCRPDGSDVFLNRRPELYQALTEQPSDAQLSQGYASAGVANDLEVALVRPSALAVGEAALKEVAADIEKLDDTVELVVLPELFWCADALVNNPQQEAVFSERVENELQQLCVNHRVHIATSLVERCQPVGESLQPSTESLQSVSESLQPVSENYQHVAVLIGPEGRVLAQPQLHRAERHQWAQLGDELTVVDLPWGRCALLTGDDSVYPELVKVLALQGVHLLLLPFDCQESWENNFGLLSRAAENRMCLVASSRATPSGSGLVCSLEREFTIMTPWHTREFDGHINYPITTHQCDAVTRAVIHPAAAANKLMSMNTDLLLQRPWHLSQTLVS